MRDGITYIKVFLDYLEAMELLGDAEKGRLFTALLTYARTGEAPQLGGNERFIFPVMRAQIDRDAAEYAAMIEKKSEAGKKGGRPPKAEKADAFLEKQEKQKKQVLFSESKKSKDKDKDKDKDEDKDEGYPPTPRPDWAKAVAMYQELISPMPPGMVTAELRDWCDALDADVICRAIEIAAGENKRSWQYIRAILSRYKASGLTTLAAVLADEAEGQKRKEKNAHERDCGQHPEDAAKPRNRGIRYDVG